MSYSEGESVYTLEVQCYAGRYQCSQYCTHIEFPQDLKLGNLFLNDKMEIKLGIWTTTKLDFDGEEKKNHCGTPIYSTRSARRESWAFI